MGDSEEEKKEENASEEIDIGVELSTMVEKNVIPKRIAERLEEKLKEKQVKITKEQLTMLVNKIKEIMRNYSKAEQIQKTKAPGQAPQSDENMQKFVETIEKLEKRLTDIESGKLSQDKIIKKGKTPSPKIVTTDDIEVGEKISVPMQEWEVDPLAEMPSDPESVIIIMKWLQYLIDRCGRPNLANILEYYVDIGWISQDVKINLMDYSEGITEEIKKGGTTAAKNITDLPSRDHIQSLIFIQKLKGIQLDRHFVDRIDGEISRITKKLENYRFK
jgi:flagellar protein FlaD